MFGFTNNALESFWRYNFKATKRIKLAVIGTPSSGKSYILNDIVLAFNMMGLQQRPLPLSFPYSDFAHYFYDISDNDGCVSGTVKYACRQENHYGAMLTGLKNGKDIDMEFVNIPGEVFTGNQQSMAMFFNLRKALQRTGKGVFTVTTWQSLGGDKYYVVEPSDEVRKSLNLPPVDKNAADSSVLELPAMQYGNWNVIFSYLNKHQFKEQPKTKKKVSGKYLLNHFYEVMADSLMQSLKDAWAAFVSNIGVTRDQFLNGMDRDFYFCKYCYEATDFVICDKLFAPGNMASDAEVQSAQNFTNMTMLLNGFLHNCRSSMGFLDSIFSINKGTPNIYLAFRGADMMIDEEKVRRLYAQLEPYRGMRDNIIYSCFMHSLYEYMDPGYQHPDIGKWIGIKTNEEFAGLESNYVTTHGLTTLTNQNLKDHIRSRLGNRGMGFWQLLGTVGNSNLVAQAMSANLPIAPHVYFTATPIDSSYCIYENDSSKHNWRFIRKDNMGRVISFHAVGSPLCFGTFQLAMDILVQNGISPSTFRAGEMIRRLQLKLKS